MSRQGGCLSPRSAAQSPRAALEELGAQQSIRDLPHSLGEGTAGEELQYGLMPVHGDRDLGIFVESTDVVDPSPQVELAGGRDLVPDLSMFQPIDLIHDQ